MNKEIGLIAENKAEEWTKGETKWFSLCLELIICHLTTIFWLTSYK